MNNFLFDYITEIGSLKLKKEEFLDFQREDDGLKRFIKAGLQYFLTEYYKSLSLGVVEDSAPKEGTETSIEEV